MDSPAYIVITPVRDEAAHIEHTVECMLAQTIRPRQWIIVDDGSGDQTGAIVERYAAANSWIVPVRLGDRGYRHPGTGVVQAFNAGHQSIAGPPWDFLVKLDGDLEFEPEYFERCFDRFRADPKLGIGGGVICHREGATLKAEKSPAFHVRGATKIYRRQCWTQIGGLFPAPGWDTIDEVKANMLGWHTRSFDDLRLTHRRRTGSAEGLWKGFVKGGRAAYITGYHPLFLVSRCVRRLLLGEFVESTALLCGFVSSYWKKLPRVDDPALIDYVRTQQMRRLTGRVTTWQ